ncbi:MAG: hypothetical protein V4611_01720 [Patescibacteria group bacterium]
MSGVKNVLSNKKALIIGGIVLVVVGILVTVFIVNQQNSSNGTNKKSNESPSYSTVLPNGKSIEVLGGWERISPDGTEPVFAFADTIDGVSISVSQQPLPEAFKNDVENKVTELAKKFNATKTLDADGTKVFIGTSAKGPQSVIFTREGLLILIKSQGKIKDAAWESYIQSLITPLNASF